MIAILEAICIVENERFKIKSSLFDVKVNRDINTFDTSKETSMEKSTYFDINVMPVRTGNLLDSNTRQTKDPT